MKTGRPLTFSPSDIQMIRDLAHKNIRVTEIAKMLRRNPKAIYGLMDRMNIPRQPRNSFQKGEQNHSWKGGRYIDNDGYVLVLATDHPFANAQGYVREHRLVVENQIGRFLQPLEVVHHIDGDKQNNRIDNLQLFRTNGEHLRLEMTGRKLNMTEDGKRRKLEALRRPRKKKAVSSQKA